MAHSNKEDWEKDLSKMLESFTDEWQQKVKETNPKRYSHLKTLHNSSKWKEWATKGGEESSPKMIEWCRKNNHWDKLAEQQRGVPKPEEVKKKISNKLKGQVLSEETKKKMSESRMGHGWSDEAIENLKKAARKRSNPISQYDLNGKWIKDFTGLAEMYDELGLNKRNVQIVCNNWKNNSEKGSRQCGGFIWKYKVYK